MDAQKSKSAAPSMSEALKLKWLSDNGFSPDGRASRLITGIDGVPGEHYIKVSIPKEYHLRVLSIEGPPDAIDEEREKRIVEWLRLTEALFE